MVPCWCHRFHVGATHRLQPICALPACDSPFVHGATHLFWCQFWCHPSTAAGFCLPVRMLVPPIDSSRFLLASSGYHANRCHSVSHPFRCHPSTKASTHRRKPACACHFGFPRRLMPLSIRGLCHSTTKAHFKVSQSAERHLSIHAMWNFCFCMCGKP